MTSKYKKIEGNFAKREMLHPWCFSKTFFLLCFITNIKSVYGQSYQQLSDVNKYGPHLPSVSIKTIGTLHRVKVGETLTLECEMENGRDTVQVWKMGNRVLTAGAIIVRRDRRIALMGTSLQITNLTILDGGEYSCEVEVPNGATPIAVVHTVEIMVPPSINAKPLKGQVIVRKGTTVALECQANGNPPPVVTWAKLNPRNPHTTHPIHVKDPTKKGMILTLDDVGRRDAGRYRCVASNNVGDDAVEFIDLNVLYKPEIKVEKPRVQGGEGLPATLNCHIHANPRPDIKWLKNTMPIEESSHRYRIVTERQLDEKEKIRRHKNVDRYRFVTEKRSGVTKLVIERVGIEDFANYTCEASNSMGKTEETIELRGNPERPELNPKVPHMGQGNWRISWITKSYANITDYRLLYRKVPSKSEPITYAWNNVMFPRQNARRGYEQIFSYDLKQLERNTQYEAQVQAKNKFGWSETSKLFTFETRIHKEKDVQSTTKDPRHPRYDDQKYIHPQSGEEEEEEGETNRKGNSATAQGYGINETNAHFSKTIHIWFALISMFVSYWFELLFH